MKDMLAGIYRIWNVLSDLPAVYNTCLYSTEDLLAVYGIYYVGFAEMKPDLFAIMGKAWQTYQEVSLLFGEEKYEEAGKLVADKLVDLSPIKIARMEEPKFKQIDDGQVAAGFVAGIYQNRGGMPVNDNLAKCLGNSKHISGKVFEIVNTISQRTDDDLIKASYDILKLEASLSNFAGDCKPETQTMI